MLFYLKTDSKTSPVKDSKVRQAIQYAVNKQEIADTVAYGYGQVGSLYCTPLTTGYNAEKDQGDMYDVDKSKHCWQKQVMQMVLILIFIVRQARLMKK